MLFVGVHAGACGDRSMRFRPTLIFERRHVDILMDTFEKTLKEAGQWGGSHCEAASALDSAMNNSLQDSECSIF